VLYRETHVLLEELADAPSMDRPQRQDPEPRRAAAVGDDLGMRKFPATAA
jgi:hypothetical protein